MGFKRDRVKEGFLNDLKSTKKVQIQKNKTTVGFIWGPGLQCQNSITFD